MGARSPVRPSSGWQGVQSPCQAQAGSHPSILLNAFLTDPLHYFIYLIFYLWYRTAPGHDQSAKKGVLH